MTEFTDAEKSTIRSGVMGAITLVTQADPGFFDMFKESKAAAQAMSQAPAEIREIVMGGLAMPPKASSMDEMRSAILKQLSDAMMIAGKDQATQDALRNYVTAATQQVAEAAKGVSAEEQQLLDRIHQVLAQPGADSQAQQVPAPEGQPQEAQIQGVPAAPVDQLPNQAPGN